ncbi:MAG TPA: metallophosphoesterase family protein [Smithellaceae bacterium]|jgi:serine/threonine protein phosphatase 1|nr:metallophosphoesterase family protein [Smithellaceae bacterium]HOG81495.1 metallophosphoesterase family protein [Smithellaceae bacterium]HQP25811.1 metallophosphoesterase family protein [Smithellaceae bacterium]
MNKIFAIGDIHGCFDKLQRLILEIKADPANDTLVFIGDYIDRVDGGRDVVDYILKLKKTFQNVICLRGNHESMLLRFLDGVEDDIYLANGGFATLKAYGISRSDTPKVRKKKIPPDHLKFFKSLLPYYETDQFIFVHAGLIPGRELNEQSLYDMQWIRQTFIDSDDDFGKQVVFGHTHFSEPLVEDNKIGIDTGAVYGGRLTCVELPALKFYQV